MGIKEDKEFWIGKPVDAKDPEFLDKKKVKF